MLCNAKNNTLKKKILFWVRKGVCLQCRGRDAERNLWEKPKLSSFSSGPGAEGQIELFFHLLFHFFRFFTLLYLWCLQDNLVISEEEGTERAREPQKTSPASGEGKVVLRFLFIIYLSMNKRKFCESRAAKSSFRVRKTCQCLWKSYPPAEKKIRICWL